MARWDRPEIPHKGWILVGCEDIKENALDDDFEYETCEMCHNEKIRYVHILKHPNYDGEIRVGCDCACKMTEDYVAPRNNERQMKNRATRRKNFLKQTWKLNYKGNYILKYKGHRITAIQRSSNFGFVYNGKWIWKYRGENINNLETLKLAAFDEFDEEDFFE